jgi:hypothetical protein
MRNSSKTFGKLTIPIFVLLAISLSALPAHAKYGGGTGYPDEPYLIYDANQMNAIGANSDRHKHFKLMADIDLSGFTGTDFNIIGNAPFRYFSGVFDGNGHTISNFTYTSSSGSCIGLFGCVDGDNAIIRNLGLIDPNVRAENTITGNGGVGSLVGLLKNGIVSGCWSEGGNVTGDYSAGGLIGSNWNGMIFDSYSSTNVVGFYDSFLPDFVGGFVGTNFEVISNSYSTGSVSGHGTLGGLVGRNDNNGTVINSFWDVNTSGRTTSVGGIGKTTEQMQDPNTFLNAGWDFIGEFGNGPSDIWVVNVAGGYPILLWQLPQLQLPALPVFSGGSGEPNDPYLISTGDDLNKIGHNPRLMKAHFRLVDDIDLAGIQFFTMAGLGNPFTGVFDGENHTISNLTYNSTNNDYVGLFAYIETSYARIRDLGLIDPNVNAGTRDFVGSLVGRLSEGSVVGCWSESGSVIGDEYVGGLVGIQFPGSISNSYSTNDVMGRRYVGGLVGSNAWGNISNSHSSGDSTAYCWVGGLVGNNAGGTISTSYSTGTVTGSYDMVGGLIGRNSRGVVSNSYSLADVAGDFIIGGLIGHNDRSNISNSYSAGAVAGNERVGGFVGNQNEGTVANSYSRGEVLGDVDVGGLVGLDYSGGFTSSFWDSTVNDSLSGVGNIIDPPGVIGESTTNMQTEITFTSAGWDFVGETVNGPNDIWRNCEGEDYPRLAWEEYEKYGGGTGEPNDPYLIYTSCQMNEIGADDNDWDKHFKLMADIDLSGYTGTEFNIIGVGHFECTLDLCWFDGTPFTGVFDGNGHTISNFTYEYSGDEFVGLFGYVDGESAQIKNLRLIDPNVDAGKDDVGSLVGYLEDGTITDCYVEGGSISGNHAVGGLIGATGSTPQISNCHATGNILGTGWHVGGLVGANSGTISNCYSTGSVSGSSYVGGLVGSNFDTISNCYSNGNVSGTTNVGGLVGMNGLCIPEWRCFPGTISNCYSAGSVSGDGDVGGLVGLNEFGTITDSFWDTDTSDVNNMCGSEGSGGSGCDNGNGKSTAQMQTESTFTDAGWDFVGETVNGPNDIWEICEGTNYPKFLWRIPPGDFVCPDGVNFFDYSFFASQWAEENCAASNDCDGRDLDLLGSVDIKDLRIFADNWLAGF